MGTVTSIASGEKRTPARGIGRAVAGPLPRGFASFVQDAVSVPFRATPALSADWSVVRPSAAHLSLTSAGAASIQPRTGSLWAANNSTPNVVLRDDAATSGTATVRLSGRTTAGYAEAGIVLYGSDDSYVMLQRKHNNGSPTLTVVSEFAGSPEESRRVTDPTSQDVWLRLAYANGAVTAAYSTDGTTFTQIGTPVPATSLGAARFGILGSVDQNRAHAPFVFSSFVQDGVRYPFD